MNIENLKLVRDHVAHNAKFTMTTMRLPCGSPGCVMGSAQDVVFNLYNRRELHVPDDLISPMTNWLSSDFLRAWLGMNQSDFDYIFLGYFTKTSINKVTAEETLAYLDFCIRRGWVVRGEFEWPRKGAQS